MHGELLVVTLTFAAALAGGRLAIRFGYPSVLGELLGGILLGPPLLGLLRPSEPVAMLGEFGVLLMMVLIGMHFDLSDLRRARTPGLLAAAGGFVVPAVLGIAVMLAFGRSVMEAVFAGLAMGVTSLAVNSRILVDLRILDTRIAHVLLVSALLSDLAVLIVFSSVIGEGGDSGLTAVLFTGLRAAGFLLAAAVIGTRIIPLVARRAPDRPDGATAHTVVVITGLAFAWMAEVAGFHAVLGAFVGGLFLSERLLGARTSREVQRRLTTVSVGTLAPLFFISAGFDVSLDVFRTDLALLVLVIVLASIGKIGGTVLLYVRSGNGWREAVVIGAGMNGRGAVEIIVAELALSAGLIDRTVFSILVFMAIVTTATVPVLLTRGVAWLRARGELVKAGDRRAIIVVGAQPLARVIGRLLQASGPVTLVDTNQSHVDTAHAEGFRVLKGNALDDLVLEEAGVGSARTLVAATANPEVNLLAARSARDLGVAEVIVVSSNDDADRFQTLLQGIGADVLVVPDDSSSWDDAINRGQVMERTAAFDPAQPPMVDGDFWITVGAGADRRLATRTCTPRVGEPAVVLARSSKEVALA